LIQLLDSIVEAIAVRPNHKWANSLPDLLQPNKRPSIEVQIKPSTTGYM